MLGVLGEYVWRALDAARTRPPFIIDEQYKPKKEEK
jgi:dolichol-phosphate mannosyltransferase